MTIDFKIKSATSSLELASRILANALKGDISHGLQMMIDRDFNGSVYEFTKRQMKVIIQITKDLEMYVDMKEQDL